MIPYSQDLRKRILETVRRGDGSLRQIARRFLVSVSFVTRLLRLHRGTGSLEPKPHGGGDPAGLRPGGPGGRPRVVPPPPQAPPRGQRPPPRAPRPHPD